MLPVAISHFGRESTDMETWLTVKEAAPAAKMSEQALYAAIREKQFPAIRIGRRIRIDPSMLLDWIKSGGSGLHEEVKERPSKVSR